MLLINTIRREKLRAFVEENQVATIDQMMALLPGVSLMTLHRDLNFLQEKGLVVKIRGGARSAEDAASEPVFTAREIVGRTAKLAIAVKAGELFAGAGSAFLDAGTTMLTFAKQLPDMEVGIVTSGPNIALELCRNQSMSITLCGGSLQKNNLMVTGASALETVSRLNIDVAFLAASGYSKNAGFTCGRENEAELKSLVAGKARTVILLMDTSKLERVYPYTFALLSQVSCLVTELDPRSLPASLLEDAKALPGLKII